MHTDMVVKKSSKFTNRHTYRTEKTYRVIAPLLSAGYCHVKSIHEVPISFTAGGDWSLGILGSVTMTTPSLSEHPFDVHATTLYS